MKKKDPLQSFIVFLLENYKTNTRKSGIEALEDFKKYNVFDFLKQGYQVLHTQSMNFIIEEIKEYINNRNEIVSR